VSEPTGPAAPGSVTLRPGELELLRTALRLLESTLGRDEAQELRDVKALLARLEAVSPAGGEAG
jgi:hypothetical protein